MSGYSPSSRRSGRSWTRQIQRAASLSDIASVILWQCQAVHRHARASQRTRLSDESGADGVRHDGQSKHQMGREDALKEGDREASQQVFTKDPGMSDAEHYLAFHAMRGIGEKVQEGKFPELASTWRGCEEAIQEWNQLLKAAAENGGTIDSEQARAVNEAYRKMLRISLQIAKSHGEDLHLVMPEWFKTCWENYQEAIKPPFLERTYQDLQAVVTSVKEKTVKVKEWIQEASKSSWGWIRTAFNEVVEAGTLGHGAVIRSEDSNVSD